GAADPGMVQPRNVFALASRLQAELGFENEDFFTDPSSAEYQQFKASQPQPPEDPYVTGEKIKAQTKMVDAQQKQQEKVIDFNLEREKLANARDQWITELEVNSAVDLAKPGIGAEVGPGTSPSRPERAGASRQQSAE